MLLNLLGAVIGVYVVQHFNLVVNWFLYDTMQFLLLFLYVLKDVAYLIGGHYSWGILNFLGGISLLPLLGIYNGVNVPRRIYRFKPLLEVTLIVLFFRLQFVERHRRIIVYHSVLIFVDYWLLQVLGPFVIT